MNLDYFEIKQILAEGRFPRSILEDQISGSFLSIHNTKISFELTNPDYTFEVLDAVCAWMAKNKNEVKRITTYFQRGLMTNILFNERIKDLSVKNIVRHIDTADSKYILWCNLHIAATQNLLHVVENTDAVIQTSGPSTEDCVKIIRLRWEINETI